jgi:hypothetical protein
MKNAPGEVWTNKHTHTHTHISRDMWKDDGEKKKGGILRERHIGNRSSGFLFFKLFLYVMELGNETERKRERSRFLMMRGRDGGHKNPATFS